MRTTGATPTNEPRRRSSARRGLTLSELVVAMAISAFVMTGAMGALVGVMRSTRSAIATSEENTKSRIVQEQFLYDLRAVTSVTTMEPHQIVVTLKDHAHGGEVRRISFWHDAARGALMRTDLDSGEREVVASGVESVTFNYFKRGSNKVAAARTADINAIQVEIMPRVRSSLLTGRNQSYVTSIVQLRNQS